MTVLLQSDDSEVTTPREQSEILERLWVLTLLQQI